MNCVACLAMTSYQRESGSKHEAQKLPCLDRKGQGGRPEVRLNHLAHFSGELPACTADRCC